MRGDAVIASSCMQCSVVFVLSCVILCALSCRPIYFAMSPCAVICCHIIMGIRKDLEQYLLKLVGPRRGAYAINDDPPPDKILGVFLDCLTPRMYNVWLSFPAHYRVDNKAYCER